MTNLLRDFADVLPTATARVWPVLAQVLPAGAALYGGTALAVRLRHRQSRDLDFFFDAPLDLVALSDTLGTLGAFAVETLREDTLNGYFESARVQFLASTGQRPLEPTTEIVGIPVASLRDLAATKLKVVGDRGELRDYFDLMIVEQRTTLRMEAVLGDYDARYQTDDVNTMLHLVRALGSFDDVADDPGLPERRSVIEGYWRARQPALVRALDITGIS
jgi:predicted nucleotidyltransferase component of viral defense system